MTNGMNRLRSILQAASVLLLAVAPLAGQPADLELTCRPEHALLDQRRVRPADIPGHLPFSTYLLFDNPQLFELRVSLINISPSRQRISDVEGDWTRALKVRVLRDGAELGPGQVRVEPVKRLRRALVYSKDGVPIEEPRFGRQVTSPGAEPLMEYDDYRREEETVAELPRELATYEEAVVVLRLRASGGGDLPLGVYQVSVADEANHVACDRDQLVVMRTPDSPLDTVDAHVIRANAHQAEGDLKAAADEMARATELAPEVLKGWFYRSVFASLRNDTAGMAEAATRVEELLANKAGAKEWNKEAGILKDARVLARQAPELRRRAAAEKEKP